MKSKINEKTREKIIDFLVEIQLDILRDDMDDARWFFKNGLTGFKDFTDEELIDQFKVYGDPDDADEEWCIDALAEAKADVAIHDLLTSS